MLPARDRKGTPTRCRLSSRERDKARMLGRGNVSLGIRLALHARSTTRHMRYRDLVEQLIATHDDGLPLDSILSDLAETLHLPAPSRHDINTTSTPDSTSLSQSNTEQDQSEPIS